MFAGKKSAQIREILISESAWEEMTCLFAPSLMDSNSFNLYKQAPALVDNILATLNITRVAPVFYDTAS
ncbi:DNA-binding transcriptional regulator EnvR [Enterobacter hormaechei]|nr:DNA-binding transcriptional regulator EnvR [Enterobacter hormaechei]